LIFQCFLTLQFIPIPVSITPYHSKMFNALIPILMKFANINMH
jgi:hypothetical protein